MNICFRKTHKLSEPPMLQEWREDSFVRFYSDGQKEMSKKNK